MHIHIRAFSCFCLFLITLGLSAQTGMIRGTVYEESTGETLFGVAVKIQGTTNGAVTDFDGKFQINVAPGTHTLDVSFISFKKITITDVTVTEGEVTLLDRISMLDDIAELEAIVVTADVIKNSESALLTVKRKSVNVMDGVSAENFRKIGDSNAGEAAKRVPGVSVEGGKYVYVRGLGDRYTKTTLNNVDIPGLDPDRNSIQIDVFPTSLIDNMVILKSFTSELPADFTGGIVNIETKDFPEEKVMDVSASVSYNPSMHFNSDYLNYEGSSTDILGFDNGDRELSDIARQPDFPTPLNSRDEAQINSVLTDFSPTLGAQQETSFMDYSLGLTMADQLEIGNGYKLGYLFSGNYKNTSTLYDDAFFGEYQLPEPADEYQFVRATTQEGVLAMNNVLLGGLAGLALKNANNKLKFNVMHLQNGESRAGQFFIDDSDDAVGKSGFTANSDNLEYSQRSITNFLLNGEHYLQEGAWKIDWRGSSTISSQDDPDIRKTAFTELNGGPGISAGAAGVPNRIWRELDETNLVGKVDITKEYRMLNEDAKLKFGSSQTFKERDYEILVYQVQINGRQPDWLGDPDEIFSQENLFPNGPIFLQSSLTGGSGPNPNAYNSTISNTAFYVSNEFTPFPKFKSILGLRAENFVQKHTGRDNQQINVLEDDKVLDALDFFPSANVIYALGEKQNLRTSYTRTIARPSFKELSFAQILDPVSNRIFNGGLFPLGEWDGNLTETRINNFDLRWELFMNRGQLFSISAFYKTFDNPIELVRIPEAQTNNEFQPRNVGDGEVRGLEFEFRKSLDFITYDLANFNISGNLTLVQSKIDRSETELRARENFRKNGETIESTRDMAGQAPWIINAGLGYNNPEIALDAGLFYNVKGETLTVVGGGLFPDVYSQPFHSLNFNLNKSVGADQRMALNFSVTNILNDRREEFFQGFQAADQTFQSWTPGTSIGLGIKYSF